MPCWLDEELIDHSRLLGHRQVTDAYLAQSARTRRGKVLTLDKGFCSLHSDVARLLPTQRI